MWPPQRQIHERIFPRRLRRDAPSWRWRVNPRLADRPAGNRSHVPVAPKGLQPAAVVLVLGPARPLRDIGKLAGLQLDDDLLNVSRLGLDVLGARPATQRAVPDPIAMVVVERHRRD